MSDTIEPLTYQQLLLEKLTHTLGQRCSQCYDDYLYDTGKSCDLYKKLSDQLSNYCEG